MKTAAILWVDCDTQHAAAAQQLISAQHPGWRLLHSPAPGQASRAWDAMVLCLDPAARELPDLREPCATHPVLLCLDAAQEALAARAFRDGLGDYLLRAADGQAHLAELMQRLAALLRQRLAAQAPGAPNPSARMLALLQEQRAALQATLASISQGIFKTGPDGRISVYNQRALDLLDLPESLLANRPTLAELTRLQAERGDFGPDYGLVGPLGQDYLAQGGRDSAPAIYWRTTRDGRTLEVRTNALADGSQVRTFADVSDYLRVENQLRDSEARFRSLSDLSSDWYWEHDAQGRFTQLAGDLSVNGMPLSAVLGRTRWEIGALNMTEADWAAHRAVLAAQQPFRDLELQRRRADGSMHWISVSGVPVQGADGTPRGYRGVGRDITGRKQAEGQIERLAFYDALTGLPNRRLLLDRLQHATVAVTRSNTQGALLFIDLDNFKSLNDTLGHDAGDHLLQQAAQRLKACVREVDTVARFGGDEFVVLLAGLSAAAAQASAEAAQVAKHIAASLGQPYALGGAVHHSTPSIGIALFGPQACRVDELLKQADLAMYQAKAAGRNTQRFFDPEMQAAASHRSALEADLRRGLQQRELVLHYQPMVDGQGRLQGAEALVRWNHPQRGLMPPAEFTPLAEQTGLILPLGQWVLETACAQLVAWSRSALTRAFSLSVNVSVRQFRQADFVQQLLATLEASGANPERLTIELTESLLLNDVQDIIARMQQLRCHGLGFALDDFGTGYSSLSQLKRLPLDQIKIDRSFVRDLPADAGDGAIVRSILALAQSLGLAVVAEGVETRAQLEFLQHHGCQTFQGYHFGRPMPPEALAHRFQVVPDPLGRPV
ncbi:putative bifunctional diguanylate cyclase/phosphodiesterase [Verminephrobacter eiseniae]|uniref:Diguanylate cyclase/phosphodiesterase with PAS/PAC sensor(S) n=1 Tax=Verminephrobacter eiseniae (strain EF01-2) TaxID=391735 RepID=A1WHK4_VEREI|nr:EAL domain-containing protein [Verminephrobacter eiseniae]ABM57111.1 diguanylate cyclase/phosphodiesterase with PAS/PAC sensor(s) [Verminephrobacter eiseniae EF01-2]MCW5262307.1 GGDEF domain-containing protein [Verminephrobacter eiseniae]MCW5287446.1 GGDEF domain-containing protein [Verminephrobacter eiseniae]MCW5294261.1 GGDEF domain-containing protein [Verminephrobacter eiseniae]MCW5305745.1 GGDEF domain-containing protein [Verminephrobacter eiseniae]